MQKTTNSSWVMRGGALTATRPQGNEFLPMIEGVYMQPVALSVQQVKALGIDMSRVTRGQWDGRPVWIVGASSASDTTSVQFSVDTERNVVTRMIMAPAQPPAPPMDIHLDGYVPLAGGWLATKVSMFTSGASRQIEVGVEALVLSSCGSNATEGSVCPESDPSLRSG